ncbi:hypothetical protein L6164_031193 [Bauhinia variegata]|uniref:Uncharacterized protein n=1 Tax=Bauhinia variegata TaxID=167791 RepID=A0ACB9LE92_BAUVA|nr:hypothetical protein L6164_031193 [Bauhinia variegata]
MPSRSASRRKPKRNASNKTKNLTKPNRHSSPNIQSQGRKLQIRKADTYIKQKYPVVVVEEEKGKRRGYYFSAGVALVSAGQNKMEGSLNGTLEETQKVESQSEQDKEVEIKSSADSGGEVSVNENPESLIEQPKENEEESKELIDSETLEEKQEVSESVVASIGDFTEEVKESVEILVGSDKIESESKQEEVKDLPSQEEASGFSPTLEVAKELEEKDFPSSLEKNELPTDVADESLGTEPIETNEVLEKTEETQAPSLEDNSGSSLPLSDVVPMVTEETTLIVSDETNKTEAIPKGIEETATDVKIEESSVVHETSKETTNESSQPVVNVPADETTSVTVQDKTEIPRSMENPTTISVNERQQAGWRSCCGLLEVLRGGDR